MSITFMYFYIFVQIASFAVTHYNASDYQANGLLSDYIGWTDGLTGCRTIGLTHYG